MPSAAEDANLRQREILRETIIVKTYHAMVDDWEDRDRDGCELNLQLVREVSHSYFLDIDRKKIFHRIKFLDAHKRAAYTVKWIMRYRPVQIVSGKVSKVGLLANEMLALHVAFRKLGIEGDLVEEAIVEHFFYMFRFRTLDTNALAMAFCLLQKAAIK